MRALKNEKNALIIGTHALIQEKADFSNLSLAITDEQHRFGVKQRESFSDKGRKPHILVMSATPIPRTLAIIIYGDMDISVINEVPAKRLLSRTVCWHGVQAKGLQLHRGAGESRSSGVCYMPSCGGNRNL